MENDREMGERVEFEQDFPKREKSNRLIDMGTCDSFTVTAKADVKIWQQVSAKTCTSRDSLCDG